MNNNYLIRYNLFDPNKGQITNGIENTYPAFSDHYLSKPNKASYIL